MHTLEVEYLGDHQTKSTHLASGKEIYTDAPHDNGGKARAFAASDMVCSALCSSMMTMMGMAAIQTEANIDGMKARITKTMQLSPRRLTKIEIAFTGEFDLSNAQRRAIVSAAMGCPKQLGLSEDILMCFDFGF